MLLFSSNKTHLTSSMMQPTETETSKMENTFGIQEYTHRHLDARIIAAKQSTCDDRRMYIFFAVVELLLLDVWR